MFYVMLALRAELRRRGDQTLEAMHFNASEPLPAAVRAAYRISVNEYNGV